MKLLLEFLNTYYTVRRLDDKTFAVAKFSGGKAPDYSYKVKRHNEHMYFTESPGFSRVGQKEKTIRLVKKFLADKEPKLAHYTFDDNKEPVLHKFQFRPYGEDE